MGNINIAELLKDCPQGMELDCTTYSNVQFMEVDTESNTIILRVGNKFIRRLNKYGQDDNIDYAKCVIFPKGKTTWEGFVPPYHFKDGDVIVDKYGAVAIYKRVHSSYEEPYADFYCGITSEYRRLYIKDPDSLQHCGKIDSLRLATEEEKQELFDAIKEGGYKWNAETKTLEKLIVPKFKVGDKIKEKNERFPSTRTIDNYVEGIGYYTTINDWVRIEDQDNWELVPTHKFKVGDKIVNKNNLRECWYVQGINTNCNSDYFYYIVTKGELANLHFKDQDNWELVPVPKFKVGDIVKSNSNTLFDYKIIKITDTHYTLESIPGANTYDMFICEDENWKLVPKKFDISNLKAYDKVLVRDDNNSAWINTFFGFCDTTINKKYPFVAGAVNWVQCIPYEGNEHLLGTCDDCDNYYKTWK